MTFSVGTTIGFVLSTTLLSLISSAVNAVIVLWAEAPREFYENHPVLANYMTDSWKQAYPDEFQ